MAEDPAAPYIAYSTKTGRPLSRGATTWSALLPAARAEQDPYCKRIQAYDCGKEADRIWAAQLSRAEVQAEGMQCRFRGPHPFPMY